MSRVVVNVAIGQRMGQKYLNGQNRLRQQMMLEDLTGRQTLRFYTNGYPAGCPTHLDVPYAFKAYAMKEAAGFGQTLLWCDCSIVLGPRPLNELWEKIEIEGYWFCANYGFTNYEWTAESAYNDLFSPERTIADVPKKPIPDATLDGLKKQNRSIPHVIATAFGISLVHPIGREFLKEYFRLATTGAFRGPTTNSNFPGARYSGNMAMCAPCGPMDVRGHRHDQTAASVIAWRLGMKLDDPPEWFAYRGGETDRTCLVADGRF